MNLKLARRPSHLIDFRIQNLQLLDVAPIGSGIRDLHRKNIWQATCNKRTKAGQGEKEKGKGELHDVQSLRRILH